MKISLITITYNNLANLRKTVESVLRQTYSDFQFIIVDGMSTDGTDEFLNNNCKNLTVIKSEPKGVYNAINVGIKAAQGEIIGLLNAGDVFTSQFVLNDVAHSFDKDPSIDFIYGDIHFVSPHGYTTRYYSGAECSMQSIADGFAPPHPSLYMRKNLFDIVGLYDESFILAADFEMFVRLFSNSKIKGVYLPFDMVEMARGGISSHWRNRLYTNNVERMRALRNNGINSSWIRIILHYFYILRSSLCRKIRNPQHIST